MTAAKMEVAACSPKQTARTTTTPDRPTSDLDDAHASRVARPGWIGVWEHRGLVVEIAFERKAAAGEAQQCLARRAVRSRRRGKVLIVAARRFDVVGDLLSRRGFTLIDAANE